MSKFSIPNFVWAMVLLGPIVVLTAKHWEKLPFFQSGKMVKKIEIIEESYNPKIEVLSVKLKNKNFHDIANIETECLFLSSSGAIVHELHQTWWTAVHAQSEQIATEKVSGVSLQAESVACTAVSAEKLDTYKGKEMPDITVYAHPKPST
jgi:hypothetical protein